MADEEINYVKEVMGSNLNLSFIGVMAFLMLVVNFLGFLPLLLAGEIGALFIAQHPRVQLIIRARQQKHKQLEVEDLEADIITALPPNYQADFQSVRRLCEEIERRSGELGDDLGGAGANVMLSGIVEKLSAFRYDYARMLRAHHLLSARNYQNIGASVGAEISRAEKAVAQETAPQVRQALMQNLNVLRQRLARVRKLDELVRLLEARLQVIRNSLGLIQDEVYSFTDVAGISGLVDNLLTNLSISDEFRQAYEDVLGAEPNLSEASALGENLLSERTSQAALPPPEAESSSPPPRSREKLRRVK